MYIDDNEQINLKKQLKSVGENVFISKHVEIKRPHLIQIGNNVAIDSGFYITTAGIFGDHIHIAPYTTIIGGSEGLIIMDAFSNISTGGKIITGSDQFLGEGLISAPGIPMEYRDNLKIEPVYFKKFANVGANVTVLPGVTLGEGSVVGACSLVTKDTEPWTIYFGVPAIPIKIRRKDKLIEFAKCLGY